MVTVCDHSSFSCPSALARSLQRGDDARKVLESEGLRPSLLELDVDSTQSIHSARDVVKEKYGQLDVLINNAGILIRVKKEYSHLQCLFVCFTPDIFF